MLNVGDKVLLSIPPEELTVAENIRQFNGRTYRVKSVRRLQKAPKTQYTLEGCTGNCGKPYWFLSDWLFPITVESEVDV